MARLATTNETARRGVDSSQTHGSVVLRRGGAVLAACALTPAALAQCFNNPIEQSLANELDPYPGPFHLVLCIHPPIPTPCVVPAVPTLESVPVGGSSATQEYILRAVQPPDDGVAFTSVSWSAHYFDPSNGWTLLWQIESTDSMVNRTGLFGAQFV